ncbi:hypothetical protein Poli38472_008226 [Pythium oligandrum]|uniref:ribonuclease H n=1 Tax=Pythium oligandrum TaxID=41045 RepID=A0A8K1CM42_PYTOL|nr:hypothetical protein Poli38472_008226 [Pythium oligandrum]|eukprot:TMW65584.1 hypothetical protein Poli38472_008226 [Pythium oligandrum]
MGKSAGGYYAVAVGRSTGVFMTWSQAEAQVKGFPGAKFKKFPTQNEADTFVRVNGGSDVKLNNQRSPVSLLGKRSQPETVVGDEEGCKPNAKRHAPEAFSNECGVTSNPSSPSSDNQDTKSEMDGKAPRQPKQPAFYAVAKGRRTGVFESWAEAKTQVENLFSAKFKKFATREEAEAFVKEHQDTMQNSSDPDPKRPDTLVAFCDGSALQNGRFGCQAGYACIFPHNPSWNVAKKLVEKKATNNRAEYLAGLEAMKRANAEDPSGTQPLYIFSDSMLLIRSMTEWVAGWQKKNWVKADGNPVLNRDLLELLIKERGNRRVIWRHVKAHTGRSDWQSKWNDVADNAARNAAAGWEPNTASVSSA